MTAFDKGVANLLS